MNPFLAPSSISCIPERFKVPVHFFVEACFGSKELLARLVSLKTYMQVKQPIILMCTGGGRSANKSFFIDIVGRARANSFPPCCSPWLNSRLTGFSLGHEVAPKQRRPENMHFSRLPNFRVVSFKAAMPTFNLGFVKV